MRTVKQRASNMKTNVIPLIHRAVWCSEVTGNTLLALRENAARCCILNIDPGAGNLSAAAAASVGNFC